MRTDKSYMIVISHFKLYPALFPLKWLICIPNISAVRGNVVFETLHDFYRTAIFFYITKDDSPAQIVMPMDVWKTWTWIAGGFQALGPSRPHNKASAKTRIGNVDPSNVKIVAVPRLCRRHFLPYQFFHGFKNPRLFALTGFASSRRIIRMTKRNIVHLFRRSGMRFGSRCGSLGIRMIAGGGEEVISV